MVFIHEHSSCRQNPSPATGDAEIERIAQIIVGAPTPFLRVPYTSPAKNFARNIRVQFPLLLLLFFIDPGRVELAANIMGWMQVSLEKGAVHLIIPVLRQMKRGLDGADKFQLLAKLVSHGHFMEPPLPLRLRLTV